MRLYFSWLDDEMGTMDDQEDSNVANMIANGEDVNFDLGISINFKQYIGEDNEEVTDNPETPNGGTDSGNENTEIVEENTPDDENAEPVVE